MKDGAALWTNLSALAALAGVLAYALFGGADFGGGIWDLFASGPRKYDQRRAIQKAMGPVWEANHVWLIFVIVVLFTCFPQGYVPLSIALFLPFHLALVGIMLRGAAFVFRSYFSRQDRADDLTSKWGIVFGAASIITPVLLGAAFGVVTEGGIRVDAAGHVSFRDDTPPWVSPYCVTNGLLALSTCAYLAAVYLTNETTGELREDFRHRAIVAGTTTAFLAGLVVLFAWQEARWFFDALMTGRALLAVIAGLVCFAGSAWSVFTRRFELSRFFSAGEIALLLLGWALAQHPYLVYPDIKFTEAAAPTTTLRFVVLSLIPGAALLLPSLWLLFSVFKSTVDPVKPAELP